MTPMDILKRFLTDKVRLASVMYFWANIGEFTYLDAQNSDNKHSSTLSLWPTGQNDGSIQVQKRFSDGLGTSPNVCLVCNCAR